MIVPGRKAKITVIRNWIQTFPHCTPPPPLKSWGRPCDIITTWYSRWLSSPEVVARTATASETLESSDSENQTGGDCGYVSYS